MSLADDLARLRDLAARSTDARANLALAGIINLLEDAFGELDSLRVELARHIASSHRRRHEP